MYNLPHLVKESKLINMYPGYIHIFFKSFKEIDTYFTEQFGNNWRELEWAKVWLRGIWKENRKTRANGISKIKRNKSEKISRRHYIKTICKSYAQQDKPPDEIINEIKTVHGIAVRKKTLFLYAGRSYSKKFENQDEL